MIVDCKKHLNSGCSCTVGEGVTHLELRHCWEGPGLKARTAPTDGVCFTFTSSDSAAVGEQHEAYGVLVQTGWNEGRDARLKKQNAQNRNPKRKHVVPLSQQFHTPNVTCMNQEAFFFPYSFSIFLSSLVYMYFFSLLSISFTGTRIFSLLVPLLIFLIQVIGTPVTGMSFLAGLHKRRKINK